MPEAASTYDYAVVRVVPRVEREEFVNAGVIVSCPARGFLECRIALDENRLRALDPAVDLELVSRHLASIEAICRGGDDAGPIGRMTTKERFRWLTSPRSTIIQTSPAHTGRCEDPAGLLAHLVATMVAAPGA